MTYYVANKRTLQEIQQLPLADCRSLFNPYCVQSDGQYNLKMGRLLNKCQVSMSRPLKISTSKASSKVTN
eukprot:scaffold146396_cov73-Cyclotella_meneghiniana.AAC.4